MKIIADSGSTKCTWLLTDGVHTREVRTRGINAVQHSPEQIREALCGTSALRRGRSRLFYGAGCGHTFPDATAKMVRALADRFGAEHVEAESDLLGAARALFGRGEGVACILGTGSNSCWCRGGEIVENVPPLGYVLGDEGSGATLGAQPRERHLQRAYFPARRVSRGARTDLRGDHPPGLPGTLRQPFSGIVRAVCPCASGPPRYQGHGREELRRFRRAQPERLSRPSARGVCGRRCGRFRGFAARNADALRPRGGDDRPLSGGRIDRISLWKTE